MISNFDHIHLYASDLSATLAFYERTLGADRVGAIPNSHGGHNHLVLLGGQFLAISDYPPGHKASEIPPYGDGALAAGFGVAHLGLNVDELEPVIKRLAAAGVAVHSPPQGEGAIRYVYFTAPDGVVIELTQYALPAKLRVAASALKLFNIGVHKARLRFATMLVKP